MTRADSIDKGKGYQLYSGVKFDLVTPPVVPEFVSPLARWFTAIGWRLEMHICGPSRKDPSGPYVSNHDWKPGMSMGDVYDGSQAMITQCSMVPGDWNTYSDRVDEPVLALGVLDLRVIRSHVGEENYVHRYTSENGRFTCGELAEVIAHHERLERSVNRCPFDGPNTHHIYFEGLAPDPEGEPGVFATQWGS